MQKVQPRSEGPQAWAVFASKLSPKLDLSLYNNSNPALCTLRFDHQCYNTVARLAQAARLCRRSKAEGAEEEEVPAGLPGLLLANLAKGLVKGPGGKGKQQVGTRSLFFFEQLFN